MRGPVDLVVEGVAPAGRGLADGADLDAGSEAGGFASPVLHDAGRGDDEEPGVGIVLQDVEAQGEGLDGLPEAHVVGEDPAEPVAVQERQPVEALLLVVAERGVEARPAAATGSGAVSAAMRPMLSAQRCDCSVTTPRPASSSHQLVWNRLSRATPVPRGIGQAPGLVDELPQPGELGSVEAQPGARRQDERLVAAVERGEEAGEVDGLAVDAHLDVEVEPVVALPPVVVGRR